MTAAPARDEAAEKRALAARICDILVNGTPEECEALIRLMDEVEKAASAFAELELAAAPAAGTA